MTRVFLVRVDMMPVVLMFKETFIVTALKTEKDDTVMRLKPRVIQEHVKVCTESIKTSKMKTITK